MELFTSSKFPSYAHLHRTHVFGCPAYVLDPKLQDGKKLPKWTPRSRRGQYLGPSPDHSTIVGRILNLRTGSVSPQFHVVYDDLFTTVPNAEHGGVLELENFREERWRTLIQSGVERTVNVREYDHDGRLIPLPTLDDEWLTPAEIRLRDAARRFRRARRARDRQKEHAPLELPRQATRDQTVPEPVSAPEGDGQRLNPSRVHVKTLNHLSMKLNLMILGLILMKIWTMRLIMTWHQLPMTNDLFRTLEPFIEPEDIPDIEGDDKIFLN